MNIQKGIRIVVAVAIFAAIINYVGMNSTREALSQGLVWGVMALGVWITFRVINFADLTVEGSFVLGAGLAAMLVVNRGMNPLTATLIATVAGMGCGLITGFFHTVMKIPPLLSGILTMTGMYSITLRIMGMPNIPAMVFGPERTTTVMTVVADFMGRVVNQSTAEWLGWVNRRGDISVPIRDASIVVGIIFVIVILVLLRLFFNTELGYAIRATGDNEAMVKAQGINSNRMKVIGLALGNACVALSGALVFQTQSVADINMGFGIIVVGLASVIIGEVIFSNKNSHWAMAAVVLGSILYRIIIAFVLSLGVHPNDFRLANALLIAIALSLPMVREKLNFHIKKLFWGGKQE